MSQSNEENASSRQCFIWSITKQKFHASATRNTTKNMSAHTYRYPWTFSRLHFQVAASRKPGAIQIFLYKSCLQDEYAVRTLYIYIYIHCIITNLACTLLLFCTQNLVDLFTAVCHTQLSQNASRYRQNLLNNFFGHARANYNIYIYITNVYQYMTIDRYEYIFYMVAFKMMRAMKHTVNGWIRIC